MDLGMHRVLLISLVFFEFAEPNPMDVFKIHKGTGIKMADLWNAKNLHCGDVSGTGNFRHGYLDKLGEELNVGCIKEWYTIFESGNHFLLKYTQTFKYSADLLYTLRQEPDFLFPETRNDIRVENFRTGKDERYLTNIDNFEFLNVIGDDSTFYSGVYYDPLDKPNMPKFYFNNTGTPYQAGVDPSSFAAVEEASFCLIKFWLTDDACLENFTSAAEHSGPCPQYTPPVISPLAASVTIGRGTNATLVCRITSLDPLSDVRWVFTAVNMFGEISRREIRNDSDPYKYGGVTATSPSLIIYNFQEPDVGQYECNATNSYGTTVGADHDVQMRKEPPIVLPSVADYQLPLGDTLTITCTITANPPLDQVVWYKNGVTLSECGSTGRMNAPNIYTPSLVITSVETCDLGEYKCSGTNHIDGVVHEGFGTYRVISAPFVTVPDTLVETAVGNFSTISCSIVSYPDLSNVRWNITTSTMSYTYDGISGQTGVTGGTIQSPSLVIPSPTSDMTGIYTCIGTNSEGSMESDPVSFNVFGVQATINAQTYSTVYGSSIDLGCTVRGLPNVENVAWKFTNGTEIDTSNTAKYSGSTPSTPTLTILNATFNDATSYVCVARNVYHEASSDATTLTVNGSLPTATTTQTTVMVNSSSTLKLVCGVRGIPQVLEVYWRMKDGSSYVNVPLQFTGGTLSSTNLILTSVQTIHQGIYVCFARNAVGTAASSDIQVMVDVVQAMCPCDCAYKERLAYWATQNRTNYTMEELRIILAPVIAQLENDLKVNTKNLSSSINKLISVKDNRPSSISIGVLGILFLTVIFGGIVLLDIVSLPQYISAIKKIGHVRKKEK